MQRHEERKEKQNQMLVVVVGMAVVTSSVQK